MAHTTLHNVRFAGCSVSMGELFQRFEDVPDYYNNDPALLNRLKKTVGFGSRRIALPATTSADLCEHAARNLLDALHLAPNSLDAIISVTQTADYVMPGNAHVLHKKLGLTENVAALDVESGCSGYVYGLWLAAMLVNCGLNRVLLVAGDTLSTLTNPQDRTLAPLFGDAGSATIVERIQNAPPLYFILHADGTNLEKLYIPAGGARQPASPETNVLQHNEDGAIRSLEDLYMDGFAIFEFAMNKQPTLLRDILDYAQTDIESTDFFVFHQANRYIVETIAKSAKIPPCKAPSSGFTLFGNQNSASIPGVLCGLLREDLRGKKIQAVLQGYGSGLSWGACHLTLDAAVCLEPQVYAPRVLMGQTGQCG